MTPDPITPLAEAIAFAVLAKIAPLLVATCGKWPHKFYNKEG
jgi:hypothetical protein